MSVQCALGLVSQHSWPCLSVVIIDYHMAVVVSNTFMASFSMRHIVHTYVASQIHVWYIFIVHNIIMYRMRKKRYNQSSFHPLHNCLSIKKKKIKKIQKKFYWHWIFLFWYCWNNFVARASCTHTQWTFESTWPL